MYTQARKESGQVLVILMLGIVGLLMFTALAIDGGMYYSDRRYDQNGADSAALAGGGAAASFMQANDISYPSFDCGTEWVQNAMSEAVEKAIEQAAGNGFIIDADISDKNGVTVRCEDAGGTTGRFLDVRVIITTETKASFAHLIFKGKLKNTVEATTRVEPGDEGPFAEGYAILALDKQCPANPNCSSNNNGGVIACGNTDITVDTGGIFSNACLQKSGNSGFIYANDGSFFITELDDPHNKFQPPPTQVSSLIALHVGPPACGTAPGASQITKTAKKNDTLEVWPGNFSGLSLSGSLSYLKMHPGLYCLTGDFSANNGDVSIIGNPADGVTIYLKTGADFDIGGNVSIVLRAPTEGSSGTPPAIPGMLIFMQEDYAGFIRLRGNSTSSYQGTVYAQSGEIDLGGNCDMTGELSTQVIGNTVRVHGNPGLVVSFESGEIFEQTLPATIDFYK